MNSNQLLPVSVAGIDVYLTFRCNLRCSHCFVGTDLDKPANMSAESARNILRLAQKWQTTDVAFLGGEPTVFSELPDVVTYAFEKGFKSVRIITNGTAPFRRFLRKYTSTPLPHVSFSLDGATAETHDSIRGPGTFRQLLDSMKVAKDLGYTISCIASISNQNIKELLELMALAADLSCEYLTVHYVSARGNATASMEILPHIWLDMMQRVVDRSRDLDLEIRFEQTFAPIGENYANLPVHRPLCVVRTLGNLMFYPDGRVFVCGLFLGQPGMHSFVWDGESLHPNTGFTERTACELEIPEHCHGLHRLSPQLLRPGGRQLYTGLCIYDKLAIQRGVIHLDG